MQSFDQLRKTQEEYKSQQTTGTLAMASRVKDLEKQVQKKDKLLANQAQTMRRMSNASN